MPRLANLKIALLNSLLADAPKTVAVSLWDESAGKVEEFVAYNAATRGGLVGYTDCADFVESLSAPRRIVVFETPAGFAGASPRTLLRETDRLLEYPWQDETVSSDDLEQLEMTLLFQLA